MDEIACEFREELQDLLNKYKDKLSTPAIMRIAQSVFSKTIGFRDNPEHFIVHPSLTGRWTSEYNTLSKANIARGPDHEFKKTMQGDFNCTD